MMNDQFHLEVLPETQQHLLDTLSAQPFISDFYMAGGTCLALQIGHRQSVDFDFFIPSDFSTSAIVNKLAEIGSYERGNEERNTINGSLNEVRISFFGYKYRIIEDFKVYKGIQLAGLKDIAAMKLEAIAGRGSKKDFFDIYFLLQQFSLEEIFSFHAQKYGIGLSNQYHHLKSLVYFADAEEEIMPVMLQPVKWPDVKSRILSVTKGFQII